MTNEQLATRLAALKEAYKVYKEDSDTDSFIIYDDASKLLEKGIDAALADGQTIKIDSGEEVYCLDNTGWFMLENISRGRWLDSSRCYGGYQMAKVVSIEVVG